MFHRSFTDHLARISLTCALAALAGCGTYTQARWTASAPQSAVLVTEGVEIRGGDGHEAFVMQYMKPTKPPAHHDATVYSNYSELTGEFVSHASGGGTTPPQAADYANVYDEAESMDVQVHVEGRAEPFYGRMLFYNVFDDCTESLPKRQWRVDIPAQYLQGAEAGIVQTVFQPYRDSLGKDYVSWVLSFSSLPF